MIYEHYIIKNQSELASAMNKMKATKKQINKMSALLVNSIGFPAENGYVEVELSRSYPTGFQATVRLLDNGTPFAVDKAVDIK